MCRLPMVFGFAQEWREEQGNRIMADEKKPESQATKNPTNPKPVEEMTEEEQMEAYEESLKDTDWGHQPC